MANTDYEAWHDSYDRPGSSLHLRLLVVQDLVAHVLDVAPPGPVRLLGMCAGQGRDVLTVARRHRRGSDLRGRLIELDPRNVAHARDEIDRAGIEGIDVVQTDAGRSDAYLGAAPADLMLACGVFGNVSDDDVKATIDFVPALCAPGAWLLWTRHPRDPEIVETIQGWCTAAGFRPITLVVVQGDVASGVGAARYEGPAFALEPGVRLFDFVR